MDVTSPTTLRAATFLSIALPAQAQTAVIDLSRPYTNSPKHNANAGASRLQSAQQLDVLGFAVVKNGQLVASSAARERQNVYSVTKTFVATLIGIMIQNGDLTVSTTLEAALPNVNWAQVSSANEKRAITVGQMLSMSSGLTANCYSYGPQGTVEQTLSSPQFSAAQVGRHNYLCSGSILSYVIYQLTGRTPLQYANEHLFPALGISRSITWSPTYGANGIHEAGHGLVLDPIELAKLGSLYRQGGVTGGNSSTQLIPASFATASNVDQLTQRISSWSLFYLGQRCVFKSSGAGYGYMKWLFSTASGQADCALGHQGQFICTWPDLDVIIAITSRDSTDYTSSCELLDLVASGLDFDAEVSSSSSPPPTTRPTQRHTPSPPPSQHTLDRTPAQAASSSSSVIGIAVGGVAGVVVLVALIVVASRLTKKPKSENVEGAAGTELAVQTAAP